MSDVQCSTKHDWYQSANAVVLTILKRGVNSEDCNADCMGNGLTVRVRGESIFAAKLYNAIDINGLTIKCTPSKIEVILPKLIAEHWPSLTSQNEKPSTAPKQRNDWDRLAKEAEEEEKETQDGVEKLFSQIYQSADDDTKKAMLKSFTESGGTVLSTNWNEIGRQKTEIKPPEGMEFKKYEY